MLRTFEEIFGHKMENGAVKKDRDIFWKKCMFVVTHLRMNKKEINPRHLSGHT